MLKSRYRARKGTRGNPLGVAIGLLIISGAIAFGVVALSRHNVKPTVKTSEPAANGPFSPTVNAPLPYPAKTVAMSDATAAFGSPLALPSTSAVRPADAGAVWDSVSPGQATVAVTFPSQDVFIDYIRPAPFSDPAGGYKEMTAAFAVSRVVALNGTTPALYVAQNSDDNGANYGSVRFEANGAEIRVLGHTDEASLEAIAQSILTQLTSRSSS